MPKVRFPKVNLKLGFLKKLLCRRSDPELVVSEPVANVGPDQHHQQDEKTSKALEEPNLEECPICHDPVGLENPEGILESWVHLHCNHKFGTHCIQTWLQESAERDPHLMPSCPICRTTAKHPCGHPVTMTPPRFSPFALLAASMPPSTPTSPPVHVHQNRRPRRRLSRRWGHPHRPTPPRPYAPLVQTVGRCSVCAAVEARENFIRQMAMPGAEMGETMYEGRARNNDRRTAIKSMLMQTNLRRLGSPTSDSAQTENLRTAIDTVMHRSTPIPPDIHRQYMNLCRTGAAVSTSPVPSSSGLTCL
ncbi:hypothetical protein GGS21DRAFT_495768 [Xylaria nigripes]|nr:hypothetical protein GGS21DRAFT_495768 [Xylaria nigripes]